MDTLLQTIIKPLTAWFAANARVLPWRTVPTPYRVWVSEIMLQQTRVEAVKPYFARFIEELPDVRALAEAPEAQILKLWQGLGYYSRVRNLQKGAQEVMRRHGGEIPADYQALLALPGIGSYTAGAIASIAFGIPEPAVDGNVLRVLSRVLLREEEITDPKVKKRMEEDLRAVMPQEDPGAFNQALMELGATVCVPNGAPHCEECPLCGLCRAHEAGRETELPVRAKKKARRIEQRTVFLLLCGGRMALSRRGEQGLLAGLWELPGAEEWLDRSGAEEWLAARGIQVESLEALPGAKHIFTHVEWHLTAYAGVCREESPGYIWASGEDVRENYTLPSAFKAYFPEIDRRLAAENAP
ncbi:MAG: A/G-specific adenine glycosylase [Ruminococcaceae bacterium]|nr:A/G-specific adenine glycosylase [Oscillospiraceae bacterium]